MKRAEMIVELTNAIWKHGEFAIVGKDLEKEVGEGAIVEEIAVNGITFQQLGLLLVDFSDVLEQNEEDGRYIVVVPTGFMNAMRALAVVKYNEECISCAAYAREGLIKQNGARKAIDTIKNKVMAF